MRSQRGQRSEVEVRGYQFRVRSCYFVDRFFLVVEQKAIHEITRMPVWLPYRRVCSA